MTTREQVLRRIPDIPSLPAAVTQVLGLVESPKSGIGEIMEIIEYDPALTAEVLRLANTAYFAGPRKVASLRDAGVLFGTHRILQLVLATSLVPVARPPLQGYDLPEGQLLRHAMAVAIGSEELSRLAGRTPPNHTFTSGLLSDIGKIVLGTFLEIDAQPILQMALEDGISFEVAEQRVLGIDHAEVGAALLEFWNIPGNVVEVVRWHHDPNRVKGDPFVADLVHAAGFLSATCGLGVGVDGLNYRTCPDALTRLNASRDMLERAACNMLVGLDQIQHQLPGQL